ncbi:MAG: nitronate monooxygenase [Propionibacteriaceae bacterium]|jgi:enoyl-[acyl-carrier protein] reductase II|nr:nitronate monooxygenase [Propionibacteriaceae bacterium]
MLKSVICDLLGIQYPVFQGAMAWISDADLAAAVSNAGGLGIIAGGNAPTAVVQEQIRKARTLTDKPFGVNIMLMSPYAAEIAQMTADEKVAVVTTGAGNPAKYMPAWKQAGVTVIPVVPSSAIARLMERSGAAAVVAEGGESGGHVGDLTTMALLPQVCDAVSIPVLGAGGIADGRGMAAAFMLGACGVQVGTRFLVAKECNVHPTYKAKILKARDIDTMMTGRRLGHPVRSLKTPFSQEFFKKEYDSSVSDEELEKFGEGALRLSAIEGDEQHGCFLSGQVAGMVHQEQTAAEIVLDIVTGAEARLRQAAQWID